MGILIGQTTSYGASRARCCLRRGGILAPVDVGPGPGFGEPECHEISIQPLQSSPFVARVPDLGLQPADQLHCKWVKFALPFRCGEGQLDRVRRQILGHRIPRQTRVSRDLADRQILPQMNPMDDVQ